MPARVRRQHQQPAPPPVPQPPRIGAVQAAARGTLLLAMSLLDGARKRAREKQIPVTAVATGVRNEFCSVFGETSGPCEAASIAAQAATDHGDKR